MTNIDPLLPGIVIEPNGQTAVVNVYNSGFLATAYVDQYGVSAVTFPKTISARTTLYLATDGPVTVSAQVNGTELAGQTVTLEGNQVATVALPAPVNAPNLVPRFTPKPTTTSMPPYNVGLYAVRGMDLASVMGHTEDPTNIIQTALRRGFEFIWVSDLYKALIGQGTLPEKPILLSYDDGRLQQWSVVKPIIDTYGVKVNAFLTSDFTDGNPDGLVDSSLTGQLPGATWANFQTMAATGLWEFHNHTRIHAQLPNQTSATRVSDLTVCNQKVKANLNQTPIALAYPNGSWNPSVVQDAVTAGLKMGFDFGPGNQNRTRASKLHENPWGYERLGPLAGASSDATFLNHFIDPVIYSYPNDFPTGRNTANQLGFWTMSNASVAAGSFSTADQCSVRLDSRQNPGVAATALTTDFFRVRYGASLYYNHFSESELQNAGNGWVKILTFDINQSALTASTLTNFTTATGYTHYEGEIILPSTCAFVQIQVGYDSSYNGVLHYQSGTVEVVGGL